MLKSVRIKTFRLCHAVQLNDLGRVTALVGRNGAGKTNILQAISMAATAATALDITRMPAPISATSLDLSLDFEVEDLSGTYEVAIVRSPQKPADASLRETLSIQARDGRKVVALSRSGESVTLDAADITTVPHALRIGGFAPVMPAMTSLFPADSDAITAIRRVMTFLSAVRYYPLDEPASGGEQGIAAISGSAYRQWLAAYESSGVPGESVSLRLFHMSQKAPQELETLKSLVGSDGLGLIDDIVVTPLTFAKDAPGSDNDYYFISFLPRLGGSSDSVHLGAEQLSAGTRRILRILVSALFDKSSVMLLEQPEDGLHQGLTKKLIGLLRQNAGSAQLIFSSHSSAILNRMKPPEIRVVSMHNGMTAATALTAEQVRIAEKFMNEDGPLYDFLETIQED